MDFSLTGVEASEAVNDTNGDGLGVEAAAGGDRRGIALELGVDLEGEVVSEGEIEAAACAEYVGDGVKIKQCAGGIGITTVQVVDLAAAVEEVDVRVEISVKTLHLGTEEDVLLGVDLAVVDGVGSANFDRGIERVEGFEADVAACGDAEILATVEAGIRACEAAESGKGEGSGSGRHGLGMGEGAGYKYKTKQCEGSDSGLQSDSLVARPTRDYPSRIQVFRRRKLQRSVSRFHSLIQVPLSMDRQFGERE